MDRFVKIKESSYNLRGSGVKLSLPKFIPHWMKNPYTYEFATIWNSLKTDLGQENLSEFIGKIRNVEF